MVKHRWFPNVCCPENYWEEEDTIFSAHFDEVEPHNRLMLEETFEQSCPFSKQDQLRSGAEDFIRWRFFSFSGPLFHYLATVMVIAVRRYFLWCL